MNEAPADDLIVYTVLFVIALLAASLLLWVTRLALDRWGPREREPSTEERARSAVLQLQSVGVDVSGLLGEWSPAGREAGRPAAARGRGAWWPGPRVRSAGERVYLE